VDLMICYFFYIYIDKCYLPGSPECAELWTLEDVETSIKILGLGIDSGSGLLRFECC
jgi:hypothetical protein